MKLWKVARSKIKEKLDSHSNGKISKRFFKKILEKEGGMEVSSVAM